MKPDSEHPLLTVVKIGGNVIDDEGELLDFLNQFSSIPGYKVLVHGGGKLATKLSQTLGIPQTMIEGRRVTDSETLKIITMVYAGLVNKHLVSKLQALDVNAIGLTGADHNTIQAKKRGAKTITTGESVNFGWVGDITSINVSFLHQLLHSDSCPVLAPITHDGQGQLLNTNADSIANQVAISLSAFFRVQLIYCFEKPGVLLDINDPSSVISRITPSQYSELKSSKKVFEGMIPKLDNAFEAISKGVNEVILGQANQLVRIVQEDSGTRLVTE